MEYAKEARRILEHVGGKDNVRSLAHCATRLRFVLQDESLVNEEGLGQLDVVKGTFSTNGQYQIIIGAGTVNLVCDEIQALLGNRAEQQPQEAPAQKGHYVQRGVKLLSDIFVPIIPAIVAGGLLMGLYNVLSAPFFGGQSIIQLYPQFAGLANMINTFSNAPFTFLPVLIAFSATKKFGGNPFLGAAMGMIMVHPDLLNAYNLGKVAAADIPVWNLFGFSVNAIGYQGTVLPVLAVSWILATIEKKLHKITPSWLDNLSTPLIAILITGFLTFVFVGPLLRTAGDLLADGITWVYSTLGFVGGALFGGFYAPIVLTGMHHSFIAIETQLIAAKAVTGGSFIFVTASMSNVAQGAAVLAVLWITKNEKMKSLCTASGISALLGITEPAMFGVNLKLRYPFIAACIGSACGSAWIALRHVLAISLGAAGLPGFISVPVNNWLDFGIGLLISIVVAFVMTFVLAKKYQEKEEALKPTIEPTVGESEEALDVTGKSNEEESEETSASITEQQDKEKTTLPALSEVYAVMDGEVKPISESSDAVFSSKAMGDGIVILPTSGEVYAPSDATVEFIFPSHHALGLKTKDGFSLLIHCGIDTVNMEGKGFTVHVREHQEVKQGEVLLTMDIDQIKAAGYREETMVVVTELPQDYALSVHAGDVQHTEVALTLERK